MVAPVGRPRAAPRSNDRSIALRGIELLQQLLTELGQERLQQNSHHTGGFQDRIQISSNLIAVGWIVMAFRS